LTFASGKAITVATTIVLARLLAPADFGLIVLATIAIGALNLVGDLGLGGVLVVRQDLDARAKGTILTLMLAMGAAVAALVAATAPLIAVVLDDARLTPILMALSITVLVGASSWFYETLLQRELEFWRRFQCQLLRSLTYATVAIAAAVAGAGVWSLVAGQVASVVSYSACLVLVTPYRVRPAFDRRSAGETLRHGRGFLAQTALGFVELNVDTVAVGRFLGPSQLGYYSMAFRMSELPYWAITESVAKVTFPGFARMRKRGESVARSYLSVIRLVALVACPTGALLSATAEPFTRVVFGSQWLPMIGPLAVLGIWGTVNHVEASLGWLLNSVGRAGSSAKISAYALVGLIPAAVLAAQLGDTTLVAWVLVGHVCASLVARAVIVARRLNIPLRHQWEAVRPVVGGVTASWLAARLLATATSAAPAAVSLAASVVFGLIVYAVVVSILEPGTLSRGWGQLGRTLGRSVRTPPETP
jgi:O-antigen/teichoic acid export membrane protein